GSVCPLCRRERGGVRGYGLSIDPSPLTPTLSPAGRASAPSRGQLWRLTHHKSEASYYSALAPDVLTIADHLVSSRSMSAAYSSGVEGSGSAPSSVSRDFRSSDMTAARSAALSLSMIARGVP